MEEKVISILCKEPEGAYLYFGAIGFQRCLPGNEGLATGVFNHYNEKEFWFGTDEGYVTRDKIATAFLSLARQGIIELFESKYTQDKKSHIIGSPIDEKRVRSSTFVRLKPSPYLAFWLMP